MLWARKVVRCRFCRTRLAWLAISSAERRGRAVHSWLRSSEVVLIGDGVYADVVVLKPFCERSSQIEGVGVGDVAAHRIAETIRTECVRGVADGLYVNALPLLQDDVPVVGWNTRDDVLGGEVP